MQLKARPVLDEDLDHKVVCNHSLIALSGPYNIYNYLIVINYI